MNKILAIFATLSFLCACNKNTPELSPLSIQTDNGNIIYNVETAVSDDELRIGLMNREELASDSGMIFDFSSRQNKPVMMWMKNTKIPLDMIFINSDNQIFWIQEKTTPMSEDLIIAPAPAKAVLELNAGEVEKHQIKIGQTVTHFILTDKMAD